MGKILGENGDVDTDLDAVFNQCNSNEVDILNVVTTGITSNTTDVHSAAWVIDEDDMASNLDTKVPTQQSVKAYVDAHAGVGDNSIITSFMFGL